VRLIRIPVALLLTCTATAAASQSKDPPPTLDGYLTDVTGGQVSAGNLVGLSQSAITQIQTSQDLVVALKPFTSGSTKGGYGLAITPARTTITPMSALSYHKYWYMRLLGATTLSYAETSATISSKDYQKYGVSIDTSYYTEPSDDPVIGADLAFAACKPGREKAKEDFNKAIDADPPDPVKIAAAKKAWEAFEKKCIDDYREKVEKTRWNASRVSLSVGSGWIKPESGAGSKESLGNSVTLGGILRLGDQGAGYISLRRSAHEVDLTTLGTSPTYKSSSLAAARFTYGSKDENGGLKFLGEISNADKTKSTESNSVFRYAVGLDKRVGKGLWLEFRLGRNHTVDGTSSQTTSLLNINFAPSSGLFSK